MSAVTHNAVIRLYLFNTDLTEILLQESEVTGNRIPLIVSMSAPEVATSRWASYAASPISGWILPTYIVQEHHDVTKWSGNLWYESHVVDCVTVLPPSCTQEDLKPGCDVVWRTVDDDITTVDKSVHSMLDFAREVFFPK